MDRSRIDSARRRLRYAWILVSMLAALGAFAGASAQDKGARFDDAVITQRVNGALDAEDRPGRGARAPHRGSKRGAQCDPRNQPAVARMTGLP